MQWTEILGEVTKREAAHLMERVRQFPELQPASKDIFKALELTPPDKVRCVILGREPYATPGLSDGLAFSTSTKTVPPTLINIYRELYEDLGFPIPVRGDLTKWARQGILLLNQVLTVFPNKSNSCTRWGWDKVTIPILQAVTRLPQPVVFLMWGSFAQDIFPKLVTCATADNAPPRIVKEDPIKKAYVFSSHPTIANYNKKCRRSPSFKGSKPFSTANELLINYGGEPIDWQL